MNTLQKKKGQQPFFNMAVRCVAEQMQHCKLELMDMEHMIQEECWVGMLGSLGYSETSLLSLQHRMLELLGMQHMFQAAYLMNRLVVVDKLVAMDNLVALDNLVAMDNLVAVDNLVAMDKLVALESCESPVLAL